MEKSSYTHCSWTDGKSRPLIKWSALKCRDITSSARPVNHTFLKVSMWSFSCALSRLGPRRARLWHLLSPLERENHLCDGSSKSLRPNRTTGHLPRLAICVNLLTNRLRRKTSKEKNSRNANLSKVVNGFSWTCFVAQFGTFIFLVMLP